MPLSGRKRVYGGPIRNSNFKRTKRVSRRRRGRKGGRKTSNFTSQSGVGSGISFRSRKVRRSKYNNMLWNSTMFKKHWRSANSVSSSLSSSVAPERITAELSTALRFGGNSFWTTAGGAINPDGGVVGTFPSDEDFVIRGGKLGLRISNTYDTLGTTGESVQVWVYLLRTSPGYNPGALASSYPIGWDPSLITDFQTLLGKIVYKKQFLLKDAEVADVEYRLKIQKIDASDYVAGRNTFVWMYMVGTADSGGARTIQVAPYYNISFTADQI